MYDTDYTTGSDAPASSTAKDTAKQATGSAKQAAGEVTDTVKQQGRQVAGEVGTQARSVAADVRHSVAGQVRTGHGKLAEQLRQFSDELGGMAGDEANSPAAQLVSKVGDSGRRAADYLQDRGPEGLLDDVQSFARRKPGTFLLAAAAAGFVIGRLGRSTMAASHSDGGTATSGPVQDAPGLYTGTGYDTASTSGYATPATGYETPATGYETATTGYSAPPAAGATFVEDTYPATTYQSGSAATGVPTTGVDPTADVVEYDQAGYPIEVPQRGNS